MSTPRVILENATYHSRILNSIAELDYAPSALAQQTTYLKDIELRYQQSEQKLEKLSETTKKERKEHQNLRDSTARRLAHKLTGRKEKFKEKENKEEREYVEALEQELTEKDSLSVLSQMLAEARELNASLSEKAIQFESLKKELFDLYTRIFDGPTAEFPDDDRLEYHFQTSQSLHDQVQKTLNAECQAAEILTRADRTMAACQTKMQEALGYSQWDMWGGGGMSDIMERNSLSTAQSLAAQVEMLCLQARNVSPFVEPIGRLSVAQGSLMSDVFFDNIFTDMAFHRKIQDSATDLARVHTRLKAQRDAAIHRADTAGSQLIEASQSLEESRKALYDFREATFQRVVAEQRDPNFPERPPSYHSPESLPTEPTATRTIPEPLMSQDVQTPPSPPKWGSKNPYAAALAERASSEQDIIPTRETTPTTQA
ncbi:hypothetical protein BDZ94DRAFT_1313034 [Collybia nuda]|uniref:Uncharacterized protein n=1 Tax=Collybia nuda TaxID=64659 RepID=A0A9P5XZW2_9AGAR|nr:hypothetical protein BDZ94DRAFT_1313034 [Collybia nuda]